MNQLNTKVGEVKASPTSYTLLARLKDIATGLGSVILGAGTAIIGKVGIDQTTDGTTNKVQARNATHGDFQVNATLQINDVDVSASVPIPTQDIGYSTLIEGQVTLSGSAQQVGANTACKNVTIQAEPSNLGYVYVGRANTVSSTVHMATLSAGSSMTFTVSNINMLYVIGTASDKVCFGGEV